LDANVQKNIEQLKAHIIQGYPDYPEFIESLRHETKDVQAAKINSKVEEFLSRQTPMSMKLFHYYV
jgi:hypothetical protein